MSSSQSEPRSISSQLVLLFTLAAIVLLSCGLGVFYLLVVHHAFEEDNAVLSDRALALAADLTTPGGRNLVDAEINARHAGEHATYWIRLLDEQNRTVTETPRMNTMLPPRVFPAAATSTSRLPPPVNYRSGPKLFSLLAFMAESNGRPYTIQIAQDRSADDRFTKKFGALVVVVLAAGVAASVVIARTVVHRGLRPLNEMTAAIQRITPRQLRERVKPAQWQRELQPLAAAFDAMLHRLEESFTRLSQFSGDLAHELRTPVANILGATQVALTRERSPAEYREVLETTATECERLSNISQNLLFLARADAAREEIKRTRFDARAAVEKILTFYRTVADDRRIALRCSGEGQIEGDPLLFERAISNLVENALRFTPSDGAVDVEISNHAHSTEVAVKDTGTGIEAEHLARVFDRFYRADPSRSSRGAGLGLALVKSIVDLHGGSARIESEPNRGTTVVLTFPAVA
jgi:two-component system heavy metal sensor histidine kinase CusS